MTNVNPTKSQPTTNGSRSLLKDRAYERLRNLIIEGVLPAGSSTTEQALAARLRMTKAPVRAALIELKAGGLVSITPRQGIVVNATTPREAIEMFEIMAAHEAYLMRRISGRLQPDQIHQIQSNLAEQRSSCAADDPRDIVRSGFEFHMLLYRSLGNTMLYEIVRQIMERLYRDAVEVARNVEGRADSMLEEHQQIAEAVFKGETESAVQLALAHLDSTRTYLLTRGATGSQWKAYR